MNKALTETRPFVKMALPDHVKNVVTIFRVNQTTGKTYTVVMPYDVWYKFRKQSRNEALLKHLTRQQMLFVSRNELQGEIRN